MKQKEFRKLTELERQAKLCGIILQKTEGKFSIEQIKNIINSLDINIQYKINIINDAKKYGEILTLKNTGMNHSWAGGDGYEQSGIILQGNLEFGLSKNQGYKEPYKIDKEILELIKMFSLE